MNNQQNKFKQDNRFVSEKGERAYKKYLEFWEAQRGLPSSAMEDISANLHHQIILHEFSKNEKSAKVFFDQTNFRILYVTDNIEDICGYTVTEVLEHNSSLIFECLVPEHTSFPTLATQMMMSSMDEVPIEVLTKNLKVTYCGVKMKHKDQSIRRWMIRFFPLELDEQGVTLTSIMTIEDVSHLMKSDFYWCRTTYGEGRVHKYHFVSNVGIKQFRDIISDREKEILSLIRQGLESKEIANQLFITSGTVDLHRKNMIARTGARDTTALVQLCLFCDII